MVKISKKVEYSLIVLKHFMDSPEDSQVTTRQICDLYKTPFDTTAKVMQLMNNNGILSSNQGIKGGYKVVISLVNLSYLELIQIIEQKEFGQTCDQLKCSLIESCNITGPIKKLNQYLYWFFKNLSVQELLEEHNGPLQNFPNQRIQL